MSEGHVISQGHGNHLAAFRPQIISRDIQGGQYAVGTERGGQHQTYIRPQSILAYVEPCQAVFLGKSLGDHHAGVRAELILL